MVIMSPLRSCKSELVSTLFLALSSSLSFLVFLSSSSSENISNKNIQSWKYKYKKESITSYSSFTLSRRSSEHKNKLIYYIDESVLLGTKPLVDSRCHFIRDPSGVFSVCHLCECRIVRWHQVCLLNCT